MHKLNGKHPATDKERRLAIQREKLLKEIEISDNIHAKYVREQLANGITSAKRCTRSSSNLGDNREFPVVNEIEQSSRTTYRNHSLNNISWATKDEVPDSEKYAEWKLPVGLFEKNALNPNVIFINYNRIKIKFNPVKFLDIDHLLGMENGHNVPEKAFISHFDITEVTSKQLQDLQRHKKKTKRAKEIPPYNCAIGHKKDYTTHRTTPNIIDRDLFKRLQILSAHARYMNANFLPVNDTIHTIGDKPRAGVALRKMPKTILKREFSHSSSIEYIIIRNSKIKTWYTTPYPEEFNRNRLLFICEYCLKYMSSNFVFHRHKIKCVDRHPPGNEIYRDGRLSVWEVDGRENLLYCQNLCLLSKLFLNSKTLYYDVEPFLFYILTEREIQDIGDGKYSSAFHFVGYFSKEKFNSTNYNLSCILTLPIYQRKGYGNFLMDFSYLLSRREFKLGTPEKPLSDLGLLAYRNYWKVKCAEILLQIRNKITSNSSPIFITLDDISNLTGMIPTDVVFGLEQLHVLYKTYDDKFSIRITSWKVFENLVEGWKSKGYQQLNPAKLIWKPLIYGPSCGVNAMGIVEPESKKTTIPENDLFNEQLANVVNFMQDDLADPRDMERAAWDAIENRVSELQVNDSPTSPLIDNDILRDRRNWTLCYGSSKVSNKPGSYSDFVHDTTNTKSSEIG